MRPDIVCRLSAVEFPLPVVELPVTVVEFPLSAVTKSASNVIHPKRKIQNAKLDIIMMEMVPS